MKVANTLRTEEENLRECWHILCEASAAPSTDPMWKWWELHIRLDKTASVKGSYSTELVPMVRIWANWAQNPETRRFVSILSAQSTKTQNAINLILWAIKEDPDSTMWVMASKEHVDEFKRKRLMPAIDDCKAIAKFVPKDPTSRSRMLIEFTTMILILRGSNSKIGLQSDPIRRVICDERREWKKGAIVLLRKRLRTYPNALEISIGTAGPENDELHLDWQDGSQGFVHWYCPHCNHSQPFRFGRKESPFFPQARKKGGIRWAPEAKVDGDWDEKIFKESVYYECESCAAQFKNHQKLMLLQSMHEVHRRPEMLPAYPSLHWNALYMPWKDCDWAEIAWEFIKALEKISYGDMEPMKGFITETLGEPWREEGENAKPSEILERRQTYKSGEKWPASNDIADILTVDVQNAFVVILHRQWKAGGKGSRLIKACRLLSFDEVRKYQEEHKIKDLGVFVDCAWENTKVFEACLKYGWNATLGDAAEEFVQMLFDTGQQKNVPIKTYWKLSNVDPHIGTARAGRFTVRRYSWSKPHYRTKLFFHAMKGTAEPWELPEDVEEMHAKEDRDWRYMSQMSNVKRKAIMGGPSDTQIIGHEWEEHGRHDYPDLECHQLLAADVCNLTR